MHAQVENMHIAAFPWGPDLGVDIGETSADVSLAAARLYAVQGGTWVFMPSVGTAAIIAPNGTVVVQAQASDCPLAQPMLYHSIDTSGFNKTKSYDINGQFSWAALQQVNEAYPRYIPQEQGTFIPHRENLVPKLKKQGPLPDPY
jgi:nitrilase